MTQTSMEEILANPGAPEAELAEEMLGPDERAALEEQRAAASPEQDADTATAEQPEQRAEPEPETKPDDDVSDLPEPIRKTLQARPEDAQNWRNLRDIAKDAQQAAKTTAEEIAKERAERARLEAEIAALRATQAAQAPQTQPLQAPQPTLPDPDADPAGYARALVAHEMQAVRQEFRTQQLDAFEAAAVRAHGKQKVDEAFVWFSNAAAADPSLLAQKDAAVDPWDFIVREKDRRDVLSQMGSDPAAYIAERERQAVAAALAEAQAGNGAATTAAVEAELAKRLPRSLAKAPGAGGQAVSDGYAGPTPMDQIVPGIKVGA